MDISKLELLIDISESKNLTQSAEKLGYTQSGVSHVIRKLEQDIGLTLLKRTNRGVELTKDGLLLLPSIRSVVSQYNRLWETIEAAKGLQLGSVCIGTYSSIAIRWLPLIIREFQAEYPSISLQIREGGLEEIERWMSEGIVDFGLISRTPRQSFEFLTLTEEPLYAVVPGTFYLPPEFNGTFPVSAFADFPYIASESGVDNDVAATLDNAGIKPPIRFYCKDDHSIIAMVENGLGITLLPSLILDGYDRNIRRIPLTEPAVRTLGIGYLSADTLSLSARAFIDITRQVVGQLTQ